MKKTRECGEWDSEFIVLKEACADLNIYAVEARYPSSLELLAEDARKAMDDAGLIWNFVSTRLPGR